MLAACVLESCFLLQPTFKVMKHKCLRIFNLTGARMSNSRAEACDGQDHHIPELLRSIHSRKDLPIDIVCFM